MPARLRARWLQRHLLRRRGTELTGRICRYLPELAKGGASRRYGQDMQTEHQIVGRGEEESVAVLLASPSERVVLDTCALLIQEFPRFNGPAVQHAVAALRRRFGDSGVTILDGLVVMLSEMHLAGRLPRLHLRRNRRGGKDETLLLAMLAALQAGDKGRAIEAAIALLDTGHVHGVVTSAATIARTLYENDVRLRPIATLIFHHFAGYAEAPRLPGIDTERRPALPHPPALRLLKSA
jgi:hypothetical protein